MNEIINIPYRVYYVLKLKKYTFSGIRIKQQLITDGLS